jgi:hypothetical protein
MNTGLQDSYNLAWKMAYVLKHGVSENLLRTYTPERRPVARKLIRSTDKYFSLAIRKDPVSRMVRNQIVPRAFKHFSFMLNSALLQRAFFRRISQTGIRYGSGVSWTGKRWPYIEWTGENGSGRDTHELLEKSAFTLVLFRRGNPARQEMGAGFQSQLAGLKLPVKVKVILYSKETRDVFRKLHIRSSACFLVRPDGYIALRGKGLDPGPVVSYFKAFVPQADGINSAGP